MPYQPTNPYPYNVGVDLREGLTLHFRVDNYDTIIKFKIEIYDLFKNQRIYTIIREMGDIEIVGEEKKIIEGEEQIIQILDETDTIVYFDYYEGESALPVKGGLSEESVCKLELTNYLKTIEQIQYEKYYNRVKDFSSFEITENVDDSYYELDEANCISGIKDEYEDYLKSLSKIVIPYQIKNNEGETKIVQGINSVVFKNFPNLQEVILPSSLYELKKEAFSDCKNLKNVNFSYGLTIIGEGVFKNCTSLYNIELVDTIGEIGTSCFEGCENLNEIKLSKLITVIPTKCFLNNKNLKNIELKNIITINKNAFEGCSKLLKLELSDLWQTIEESAFKDCKSIYEIDLPINNSKSSNQSIGKGAFIGCDNIVELTIPFIGKSIEFTGEEGLFGYIFGESEEGEEGIEQKYSDEDMKNYKIPSSIARVVITNAEKLSYGAFYNCKEIIEIILNEGLETIDDYAFYNCCNLTKIQIPSTVKTIGVKAFALEEVYE